MKIKIYFNTETADKYNEKIEILKNEKNNTIQITLNQNFNVSQLTRLIKTLDELYDLSYPCNAIKELVLQGDINNLFGLLPF